MYKLLLRVPTACVYIAVSTTTHGATSKQMVRFTYSILLFTELYLSYIFLKLFI